MVSYVGYIPPRHPKRAGTSAPKAMKPKPKPLKKQPKYDLTKPMKKLVVKEINKKEETNERQYQSRLTHLPNIPDQNTHIFRCFPEVFQSGQIDPATNDPYPSNRETRTGTKIRAMNLKVQGRVWIPVDDSVTSADRACLSCRLLVISCKKYQKWEDVLSNWDAGSDLQESLLKNGSQSVSFDGYQFGLNLPVNDELFTTHHDSKFLLNRGFISKSTGVGVPVTEGVGLAHMPFALHYFRKNIKVKNKIIKFNEETNSFPTNFSPFAVLLWTYTNGSAPSNTAVPYMRTQSQLRWKNM